MKCNNLLYKDVEINQENLDELPEDGVLNNIRLNISFIDSEETENRTNSSDGINRNQAEENLCDTDNFSQSCLLNSSEAISLDLIQQINILKDSYIHKQTQLNTSHINIPHGDIPVQEYSNTNHLLMAYPTLFCYGIGGFSDKNRKIKLSYCGHINYLCRLDNDRFRTHRSFQAVTFNIIQRSDARFKMGLIIKHSDFEEFSQQLSTLHLEDFEIAAKVVSENKK